MTAKERREMEKQEQERIQGRKDNVVAQRRQRMNEMTFDEWYLMLHDNHDLDDF
jgi:hypothetical protein